MRRQMAKALRRWADRLDPGPRINYQILVGTKGPVVNGDLAQQRQREVRQAAFHVG
ncbi:hypothetical protein [Mycobacterium sp. NS-7484]|uniref:hypothetical protein n=1 Tax=Mycobacterium sp. NS-7484 TaxID=1834161 RepID=UPI0013013FAB|nr:hypothetical protein [Mycobacterium sp. NS-7484]